MNTSDDSSGTKGWGHHQQESSAAEPRKGAVVLLLLTDTTLSEEPSRHTNQEHHDDNGLIFHVSKKVHCSVVVIVRSARTASVKRSFLGWIATASIVVAVGVVGRQRFHRHGDKSLHE